MRFKSIVFDLDGTLLNTLDDLADSVNFSLEKAGLRTHATEAYKLFVGHGARNLIESAVKASLGREAEDELIEEVFKIYREVYAKNQYNKTRPYDGIPEILKELAAAGVDVSVFSNKPQANTSAVVEHYFKDVRFSAVFGQREGLPIKPDPTCALEICDLVRTKPEQVLYIGDSGVDMKTAVAAGMYPMGVLWGFRGKDELIKNGALALAEKPSDIVDFALGRD